jgi:hypothetical protein
VPKARWRPIRGLESKLATTSAAFEQDTNNNGTLL